MTKIADCAHRQVIAGNWYSSDVSYLRQYAPFREIYHHRTMMLRFDITESGAWDNNISAVNYSIGWGSVSDQGGMNKLFRELGMPYYYSRLGGVTISDTRRYTWSDWNLLLGTGILDPDGFRDSPSDKPYIIDEFYELLGRCTRDMRKVGTR